MFLKTSLLIPLHLTLFRQTIIPLFLSLLFCSPALAQGNLLITPKRVIFEGNKRSENINLANVGKDTATYVISFINIRMKEDGTFERIETPDSAQYFAEPYLRIFPRTVTLAPNEAQTVKLQIRRTSEMQAGEYRSHLYFRAEPRQAPLGEKSTGKDSTISVKLTPVFGISIPVIVHAGESDTEIRLSDVTLRTDSVPAVQMTFDRRGNMSVYGDVTVNHISRQGKVTQVGSAKGLAVYTPTARRRFNLALDPAAKVDLRSGTLQVMYTGQSVTLAKPVVLTEKEILLR
jgi:P pilus assembly chaperone PapD